MYFNCSAMPMLVMIFFSWLCTPIQFNRTCNTAQLDFACIYFLDKEGMVPQGLAHFSERVAMRISCVTYNADMILLNCHMCSSVDMWEKFLSRFRPSCIKCGGRLGTKKRLCSNFLHFFCPLCLNSPTLHICGSANFPSRSHI